MKKIFLTLIISFSLFNTYALKVVVNRETLDHNPKDANNPNGYAVSKRDVTTIPGSGLDGTPTIVGYRVDIFCKGNGTMNCPTQLVKPPAEQTSGTGAYPNNYMDAESTFAAQNLLTAAIDNFDNFGNTTNQNGQVVTPSGHLYYYSVIWTINAVTNKINMEFTFTDEI